ncbi:vacuolar protein sorting-associated protein vts1 [Naviculisporaceae sp. PSN 640]
MADAIPAALKQADINLWKCATKATQLQTVKPIIAYWCEYWVVNQILAKSLHNSDQEVMTYTLALMDKLEQTKKDYEHEDAILDDTAGQAYVEQFAQETLDRAERVVKANKVTQQTATTFDAAATFFHLVNIWGEPDQETKQKIKYAKWNAARIAKALKEGKDPNESNPKPEEPQAQQPALDPNDPEVQGLSGTGPVGPRPVTVEEVPDSDLPRDAAGVSLPQSPASGGPSAVSDGELNLPGVPTQLNDPAPRPDYFNSGSLPSPMDTSTPSFLPSAPTEWSHHTQPGPAVPPHPPTQWSPPPANPPPPQWGAPPPTFAPSPHQTPAVASPPVNLPASSYYTNIAPAAHTVHQPAPPPATYVPVAPAHVDEAAMVSAQKHAKWAISALNFEDVPTAVKELRKALELLGAS